MREYIDPIKTEGEDFESFLRRVEYISALALVQCAQELNEIKHLLSHRIPADLGQEE
jgi:hypothetical protein